MNTPLFLGQTPEGVVRLTYFECAAEVLVEGLRACGERQDRISSSEIVDWRSVWSEFPYTATFQLVCQANRSWSIHCDNGRGVISGLAYTMARRLRTRGVRFTSTIGTASPYPMFLMEYHDGRDPYHVVDRTVGVCWETEQCFASDGDPLPFEELDGYQAPQLADRMTHERLCRYARNLGLSLEIRDALRPCYMLLDHLLRKGNATLADKLESARAIAALCPEATSASVITNDDQGQIVSKLLFWRKNHRRIIRSGAISNPENLLSQLGD